MEYRAFRAESVAADQSGKLVFLVTPFGRETVIGDMKRGGFKEEVGKGAFAKTLSEGDPLMVFQHDLTRPLARKSAGNLDLHEGELDGREGLVGDAHPADTSYARDLRALIDAKVVTGMSFGFSVVKDEWFDGEGRAADKYTGVKRILREVQLIEVSPVTRPAYGGTAISARDEASALIEARQNAAAEGRGPEPEEERAPKPYGNVTYADPKNGKYPVDTEGHARAAWSYINMPKNAAKYPLNGVTLSSVKARIKKALQRFGIKTSDQKSFDDFAAPDFRDDDAYLDDWYEIDDGEDVEDGDGEQPRSASDKTGYARMAAVLSGRSEEDVKEVIDLGPESFCVILRDDPDGHEYEAIDHAVRRLMEKPPDVKGALAALRENQMSRRGEQEPDSSTPENEDDQEALLMQMRSREVEIKTL